MAAQSINALNISSGPDAEPFTTAQAKAFLRVDVDTDDALIDNLVKSARIMCETETGLQLITAEYTWKLDGFPRGYVFDLPVTPVQSVDSISYIDASGTSQSLATTVYQSDVSGEIARVGLKSGQVWPSTASDTFNTVTITFTAGYGDASADIPQSLRDGMAMIIAHWYENREAVSEATKIPVPMGVKYLWGSRGYKKI